MFGVGFVILIYVLGDVEFSTFISSWFPELLFDVLISFLFLFIFIIENEIVLLEPLILCV
jgi:hypothetical protein